MKAKGNRLLRCFLVILWIGLIGGLVFYVKLGSTANYLFTQTDWSQGPSTQVAVHPTDQTGWANYLSKDEYVDTSQPGKITLSAVSDSVVQTTDTDFNAGSLDHTEVVDLGEAASVRLIGTTNDVFRTSLGQWGSPPQLPKGIGQGASLCYPGTGNYIYALHGNGTRDFMRYDIVNKKWDPLTPTPKSVWWGGSLVSTGDDYIYALRGKSKSFWRYSITNNSWEKLADTPDSVNEGGDLVAVDANTLYAVAGGGSTYFWKYDVTTNTWQILSPVPASVGEGASLVYTGGDYIYLLRGGDTSHFYRYSISTNTWTALTDILQVVGDGGSLCYPGTGDYIYALIGDYRTDFLRYSISGNFWERCYEFPAPTGVGADLVFVAGTNKIYGWGGAEFVYPELVEYDLSAGEWNKFIPPHGDGRNTWSGTVKTGVVAGNYIYALTSDENAFYRFNLLTEQWERLADAPVNASQAFKSDQLVYPGGDYIYWLKGYYSGYLYRYSISTNSWEQLTPPPNAGTNFDGADLIYPGSGNIIYLLKATNTTEFYAYDMTADTWTTLASPPLAVQSYHGFSTISDGTDTYIYVLRGYGTVEFYKYTISTNTWTQLSSLPGVFYSPSWAQGAKNALMYTGGDYLYCVKGRYGEGYKYSISTDTWSTWNPDVGNRYVCPIHPQGSKYIYVAGGDSDTFKRYDTTTDTWENLAKMPTTVSQGQLLYYDPDGVVDSGDEIIYYLSNWEWPPIMFKYIVAQDRWEKLVTGNFNASYSIGDGGDGVRVGDYVYYLMGYNTRNFYRYSIKDKVWQILQYTPDFVHSGGHLCYPGTGDYIYVTQGKNRKSFWRYSISNNSWEELADAPDTISYGATMASPGDGNIYLLRGANSTTFWKYVIASNSWTLLTSAPRGARIGTSLLYHPDHTGVLFCIFGGYNGLAKYDIATNTWSWLSGIDENFGAGASLCYAGQSDYIYATRGDEDKKLYRYSISSNSWERLKDLPRTISTGADLIWLGPNYSDFIMTSVGRYDDYTAEDFFIYSISKNRWACSSAEGLEDRFYFGYNSQAQIEGVDLGDKHYIYALGGYDNISVDYLDPFYRYDADTDSWQKMATTPGRFERGDVLCYPGEGDYIYALRGGNSRNFYRYSISQNRWEALTSFPEDPVYDWRNIIYGTDLVYADGYLYALKGYNTSYFYRYSIESNSWEQLTSLPVNVGEGGSLCYPGTGDYIYALIGNNTEYFYKYSISSNTWTQLSSLPSKVYYGGRLLYPGIGDYIYAITGNHTKFFYRYSISQDTWEELEEIPYKIGRGDLAFLDDYIYVVSGQTYETQMIRYNLFASGEFTSPILEIGTNKEFRTVSWTDTSDGQTTLIKVKIRTSENPNMQNASNIDACDEATNGADISDLYGVTDTHEYLQYKVYFKTQDLNNLPEFNDIAFNYCYYPNTPQTLISSVYDTTETTNRIMKLNWSEVLPVGTDIRIQLRTSPDNVNWTEWLGPEGTTIISYDFSNPELLAKSSKIILESGYARLAKDLEDFSYIQPVVIDNSAGGDWTDAVVILTIDSSNKAFWSHVQSDGDDIRFFDPATSEKLVYNLASFDYQNKEARIYIKIPSISTGEKKTIYMVYGSEDAVSESDSNIPSLIFQYPNYTGWVDNWGTPPKTYEANETYHMMGGYNNYGAGAYTQYTISQLSACRCEVIFDYYYWDSWDDDEYGQLYANDNLIWSQSNTGATDIGNQGGNSWSEQLRREVRVVFDHSGGDLILKFTSTLDQSASNESFGVDNIKIVYSPPTYFPVSQETAISSTLGSDWPYREVITITNSLNVDLTDYAVKIKLDESHQDFWSNVKTDGADIRFIDSDNTTLLSYWIESFDYDNKEAIIWVKIPSIPASSSKTIYMYYGNSLATSLSNGNDTFLFFDDFEDGDISDWTVYGNGVISIEPDPTGESNYALKKDSYPDPNGGYKLIDQTLNFNDGYALEGKINRTYLSGNNTDSLNLEDSSWNGYGFGFDYTYNYLQIFRRDSAIAFTFGNYSLSLLENQWIYFRFITEDGNYQIQYLDDEGNILASFSVLDSTYTSFDRVVLRGGYAYYADDLRLRKYVSPEPQVSFAYQEAANTYNTGLYYTEHPVIQPVLPVYYNNDLAEFQEIATKPTGSEVKYQVSPNGYEWYWFNGSDWVSVEYGYDNANTAQEINTNLSSFQTKFPQGDFYWRAFLHSADGTQAPQLDEIRVALTDSSSYYLDSTGTQSINPLHTDAYNDRYFQYKITLYSDGQNAPILDEVNIEYLNAYVTITSPNGGETWLIGSTQNITWVSQAIGDTSGTVKLEYSTDGGTTWKLITDSTSNTGTYSWTIPDEHTTQARVKITSNEFPVISDTSDNDFRIVGSFTISSPNGGERWVVGSQEEISWTTVGTIPEVKIEYSTDSGSTWKPVVENEGAVSNDGVVINDGSFLWTIPDEITSTDTCLVRISDATDPQTFDISDDPFRIIGAFTIASPNGGEEWLVGNTYTISWATTGTVSTVNLEYSKDNFVSDINTIASGVDNTGSFSWIIPQDLSETVKVRVLDANDTTVYDASDADFAIKGIKVTSPNGGEEWEVGAKHNITWESGGLVSNELTIEYSTDGGTTWNLIADQQYNDGSYTWTVPDNISDTVKIRVKDPSSPYAFDTSDSDFKIVPVPQITVTSPNGGESWIVGETYNITWTNIGNVYTNVDLEYSTDGGVAWNTIALGVENTGTYSWTIPDTVSNNCLIRITESDVPVGRDTQTKVSDTSDSGFSIIEPIITVTSPNGGEVWAYGDTRTITWQTEGVVSDNLLIEYSKDDFVSDVHTVATGVANTGSYSWVLPDDPSSTVKIRITDNNKPQVSDTSDDYFEILPHSRITITSPNGGETLVIGDTYEITWTWDGQGVSNNLTIEYSTDNGQTWNLIADQQYNDGSYTWTVPDIETNQALIRITDADDSLITDTSDSTFTIAAPIITITSPNGGEEWYATGNYEISWSSVGSVSDNLTLEYSTDGGVAWNTIATAVANTGSYLWTVPDVISSNCLIRIIDANRPEVTDTSDAQFSIIPPTITVTSPNGGEMWVVGTQHDITWTSTGADVGAIRNDLTIEYSTDGGTTWKTINTGQGNDGVYTWTIPDDVSQNCRVRIYDATRPATQDISDADFTITPPTFNITSPNGGESWIVGTTHQITWESIGSVSDDLKLEYSKDNFVSDINLIADNIPNTGSYSWTIPDDVSNTVKVRITDNLNTVATDTSDTSFSIANPVITITSPNGGELWTAGDTEQITWTWTGAVSDDLKLEYSKDNFVSDINLIADNIPNTGSYSWVVPNDVSTTVRVRITDNTRPATTDKSNSDFTILPTPQITITSPNGGEEWIIGTQQQITWVDNGGLISNNLTIQYSTDSGSTWKDIATGVANSGEFTWTVPDDYSIYARIRIFDAERADTVDISDNDFTIALPKITVISPNGGEYYAVGDNVEVKWTTEGTVSDNLVLEYTTDGSNFILITTGVPNTGSYTWTVPDEVSSTVKIKITDGDRPAVYDLSDDNFNIIPIPVITITSPNGGEEYVFGNTIQISWECKGLSISDNLTIDYSLDDFATSKVIATGVANTGSYLWAIPEDALAGSTLKIRITDANRSEITDTSDDYFRIRGGFEITTPQEGTIWYAKSTQTITWQTKGTIPKVKLEYSLDNGQTWNLIADSVDNTGSYSWTLPDAKVTTARVKISDTTDSTVYGESADFTISYCKITWYVLDYDNFSHLKELNVQDSVWQDSSGTITSPVTHEYPYGEYTTFWSKEGYIERSIDWIADGDKTVTIYLENQTTALVEWHVLLSTAYEASTDTLKVSTWLERKGFLIGDQSQELTDLQEALLEIYDGDTLIKTFTSTEPDSRGIFWFTWENTGLETGKTYFVKSTIKYRDREYTSGGAINVTEAKQNYEEKVQLQTIQTQTAAIKQKVEEEIPAKINEAKTEIKTETSKILVATEETIPEKITETQQKVETSMKSKILNRENTVRTGDTLIIRYRTYSGLSPTIDVYDANNVLRISKGVMTEIGTTGIYEYPVRFLTSWGVGDFTIVCSEATHGTLDALIITVVRHDVEEIAGQTAAILGETTKFTDLGEVAENLNTQFDVIESALRKINNDLLKEIKGSISEITSENLDSVYSQLVVLSKEVEKLFKPYKLRLKEILKVSKRRTKDIVYLKNKTQELKALIQFNQKLIDNIANEPVVHSWFEFKEERR